MKLFLIPSLLLLGFTSFAQNKILPADEFGKYIFLEVTALKSVKKDIVSANVKHFFKVNSKFMKLKTVNGDTTFLGKGKLIIQKGLAGIGHPSGEVTYDISIALRDGRYRLILTNYVVTPYERDRYGNFVPVTVSTPLERSPDKLNRTEWENNMTFIVNKSTKISENLRIIMNNTQTEPKPEVKKSVVVSTKW